MSKFCVILPAAGKSSRFGDRAYKKPFAMLENRAVWLHSATYFLNRDDVFQVILVVPSEDEEMVRLKYKADLTILGVKIVVGGKERSDSIANAIPHIDPQCDYVCVHDAARPCLMDAWIDDVFRVARKTGAAILASRLTDTIKKIRPTGKSHKSHESGVLSLDNLIPDESSDDYAGEGTVEGTLDRTNVWAAQTPQVFRRELFEKVYASRSATKSGMVTDDAMLFEMAGIPVAVVEGSPMNLKITTKMDLKLAEAILRTFPKPKKISFHPFDDERPFV
ncbi:MAG: IspD/TarI family cytidylyltransferase [Planctomycetia bacterium]|nr:IspD/TarI family cytidylyltransferase [Planctomycetia bacterium]